MQARAKNSRIDLEGLWQCAIMAVESGAPAFKVALGILNPSYGCDLVITVLGDCLPSLRLNLIGEA